MSTVRSQVSRARNRLGLNVLMDRFAWAAIGITAAWTIVLVLERLLALGTPLLVVTYSAAGLLLATTLIAAYLRRVTPLAAAVCLDDAAALKERLSSVIAIDPGTAQRDPFAAALLRDAEAVAGRIHVPRAVPLRAPALWPWTAAVIATAAALFFLLPQYDLLAREKVIKPEDATSPVAKQDARQTTAQINQQINRVKEMAKESPELASLADAIKPLELPDKASAKPEDVQRDALKVLDHLTEKIEEKRAEEKFRSLDQLKSLLPQLERTDPNDPAAKLSEALQQGDLKQAGEEIKELQQQIGEMAKSAEPEAQKKMEDLQKSLEKLGEQLKQLSNDEKLQKDLQNKAGLTEEQAKQMMNELSKMDPKELAKELQKRLGDKGMTQEQLKEMAQKLAQNEQAKQQLKEMAQKMAEAAQCMKQCQNAQQQGESEGAKQAAGQAAQAMGQAGEQMSEMEMAEQMMNEMEARLAELDDMRQAMGKEGEEPGKGGKPSQRDDEPDGTGPQYGQGYGAGTGKEKAAHKMKAEREKPQVQRGEIIGQMLFDGPQVKGQATSEVRDAVSSAVRDAADAINRDQVPRQYERAVREYFEALAGLVDKDGTKPADDTAAKPAAEEPAAKK